MYCRFRVVAPPVAKGSTRAFIAGGRAHVTSTARNLKGWEYAVKVAAGRFVPALTSEPVSVRLWFTLPRPKAHPKRRAIAHTKKPDLDKLTRAVLDALIGVVYRDDAQVVAITCSKCYAGPEAQPGCTVEVQDVPLVAAVFGAVPVIEPEVDGP